MNELHNGNSKEQSETVAVEMNAVNHEKQFARLVAAEIARNLQVDYSNRDIVVKLLTSHLEKYLCKRDGLLEQYLHTQLDILARKIRRHFNIEDSVEVNYNHGIHAKFNDILDDIDSTMTLKELNIGQNKDE